MGIVEFVVRMVDPIRCRWKHRNELGASLVEYALLLTLIAVIAIVALQFLGGTVANTLNNEGSSIA
jgi:Flp pilus assembly pilin Flp